jgi:TRAP-type C4-dicarboxylate transport system permease small subunit
MVMVASVEGLNLSITAEFDRFLLKIATMLGILMGTSKNSLKHVLS